MNNELLFFIGLLMIVFAAVATYFEPTIGLAMVIPIFIGIALMIWAWNRHNTIHIYGKFGQV
jgi:hypothetical protein